MCERRNIFASCQAHRGRNERARRRRPRPRHAFTMVELQVAVLLLAFSVVTFASLMTTQQRLIKHMRGVFAPSGTVVLTRSKDPWVRKLNTPARITALPFAPTSPANVTVANDVSIVDQQANLKTEAITVTADLTPIN
jgi:hypothetical protein